LLNAPSSPEASRGKASRGMKWGRQALQDFPRAYGRLQRWSEGVFESEWSQAQLLQVMEEIEPMTAEALRWMHITAIAATGGYARLGELIARFEKDAARAHALRLGLTAALKTPDGRLMEVLKVGVAPDLLAERFGHMAVHEPYEMAWPRLAETAEALLGDAPPPKALMWDAERAMRRQEASVRVARAQAGFLGRSEMMKTIHLTQTALTAHAEARDALAYVLAAARHWARAAADEAVADGRIQRFDEIFMLEIEEIKQMMTGEWHSRAQIDPLLIDRRREGRKSEETAAIPAQALGVAGEHVRGPLVRFSSPAEVRPLSGFIALAANWTPAWWRVALMAEGIISLQGNLLSWAASVARMGDLPTLVGGSAYALWPEATIDLFPAQNRAEMAD
jgi:hypothetical protein